MEINWRFRTTEFTGIRWSAEEIGCRRREAKFKEITREFVL
jgi:hypothetical protein